MLIILLSVKYLFSIKEQYTDGKNTIYCIVTTSINDENYTLRKDQYVQGITKLIKLTKNIPNCKIIVVENNGSRTTYLNTLGVEVFYTNNNGLQESKGFKELQDIFDCIDKYNINDEDFVVKMTGRYLLDDDSPFIKKLMYVDKENIDCLIKYSSIMTPDKVDLNDSITGLIGMRSKYIKMIRPASSGSPIEWEWARVSKLIDINRVGKFDKLGIRVCAGDNSCSNPWTV